MPDSYQDHLDIEATELYVLDELAEPELAPIEEHLLVCERCRQAVSEMDVFAPLLRPAGSSGTAAYTHATAEGAVTLEIRALPESKWSARIYGSRLEGQALVASFREAYLYLRRSFAEMFPEHLCNEGCGPAAWVSAERIASTTPAVVKVRASTVTSMPCLRAVAVVTGPIVATCTPSSAPAPATWTKLATVEELVNVIQSGRRPEAKIRCARAGAVAGMPVR